MEGSGKKPDFIAKAVRETDGKTRWCDIGVAFTNKDSITILLNALPIGDRIVLMKPIEREPKEKMNPFNQGGEVVGAEPQKELTDQQVMDRGV